MIDWGVLRSFVERIRSYRLAANLDSGSARMRVAAIGRADTYGDTFLPGAFKSEIGRTLPMLAEHGRAGIPPIGVMTVEVERKRDLVAVLQFNSTSAAQEWRTAAREHGVDASVRFRALRKDAERDEETGGYRFRTVSLVEISLVSIGAQPGTGVIGRVKGEALIMDRKARIAEIERLLTSGFEPHRGEDGAIDWPSVVLVDGETDISALGSDEERAAAVDALYAEHERLVGEEVEARKTAQRLLSRTLSTLTPAAPLPIQPRSPEAASGGSFSRAVRRLYDGERRVEVSPDYLGLRTAAQLPTMGSLLGMPGARPIERQKANLSFAARWPIEEVVLSTPAVPTVLDYFRVVETDQLSYPIEGPTAASTANVGAQTAAGASLPEAALAATIADNNLHPVGAFQPITWQTMQVPSAMDWTETELRMQHRSRIDLMVVAGQAATPAMNGIARATTYSAGKSNTREVGATASLLGGLSDAAAASHQARSMYPDCVVMTPAHLSRIQQEANAGSRYLAASGPERSPNVLWNMMVLVSTNLTGALYVLNSMDVAIAMHSSGIMMELGMQADDFVDLRQTLRIFAVMQTVFRRTNGIQQITLA